MGVTNYFKSKNDNNQWSVEECLFTPQHFIHGFCASFKFFVVPEQPEHEEKMYNWVISLVCPCSSIVLDIVEEREECDQEGCLIQVPSQLQKCKRCR